MRNNNNGRFRCVQIFFKQNETKKKDKKEQMARKGIIILLYVVKRDLTVEKNLEIFRKEAKNGKHTNKTK